MGHHRRRSEVVSSEAERDLMTASLLAWQQFILCGGDGNGLGGRRQQQEVGEMGRVLIRAAASYAASQYQKDERCRGEEAAASSFPRTLPRLSVAYSNTTHYFRQE